MTTHINEINRSPEEPKRKRQPRPEDSPYRDQNESAAFLLLSPRTLEGLRVSGKGPAFRKIGKKVIYNIADLVEWVESHRRTSTSDRGAA